MKNSTIKQFIIAAAFLMILPTLCLAVPGLINYQGRLTDGAGALVNGDRPVVFSMYTTASGGTALWSEGRTVTVTDGVFSVELGSVTSIPDTVFNADTVYLGVTVDADSEMTPRQRLTSVGYAYRAAGVNVKSTGSAAPVFVNMTGTGRAGDFNIINSGSHSSAVHASTNSGSPAINGVTTGTGNAGDFRVHNTGNFYNAVYASTDGGGSAIKCEVTGTGKAGEFRVLNPSSSAAAVYGLNGGTGNAGYFLISSAGSTAPAVYANTLGTGPAGQFDGDVQVSKTVFADSFAGDGAGLTNVNATTASEANHASSADSATNADNAALLNSMTSADIINAASDEVRMPISSVPFTIASSGSYYFTGNLNYTPTTGAAITVNADDVTIDMMGYSLTGPGKASGTNYGILMADRTNVELRNGTVRDFGYIGIFVGSTNKDHRVINIRSIANGSDGINLYGNNHLMKNCTASDNGGYGIAGQYGCTITGCAAYNNQGTGIVTDTGCVVTGNTSCNNAGDGIDSFSGCTITGNVTYNNQCYGITGMYSCTITGNTSYKNKQSGIYGYSQCRITGNTANNNNLSNYGYDGGIYAHEYCIVKGNTASYNALSNIYLGSSFNDIEENVVSYTGGIGINANTSSNFYANNRAFSCASGCFGAGVPPAYDGGGNVCY